MIVSFIGGPYDGMDLPTVRIELLTTPITIQASSGPRTFLVMPSLADRSDLEVDLGRDGGGPGEHCYELVSTPEKVEARYDHPCTLHLAAIKQASAVLGRAALPPTSRRANGRNPGERGSS